MSKRKRPPSQRHATPGPRPRSRLVNKPPDFVDMTPLPLAEIPPPEALAVGALIPGINSYLRTYRIGECHAIVTREYDCWHLSISHPKRLPSWREVSETRYRVIPDPNAMMAMILPPIDEYLNLHEYCLQVVELDPTGQALRQPNPSPREICP